MTLSPAELARKRLEAAGGDRLRPLAKLRGSRSSENIATLAVALADVMSQEEIDGLVREEFRRISVPQGVTCEDALRELSRPEERDWDVVQGRLDEFLQETVVHPHWRSDDADRAATDGLARAVRRHAPCPWFNHWSTVVIDDLMFTRPAPVPALLRPEGLDFFRAAVAWDLKVTHPPEARVDAGGTVDQALKDPARPARWLYDNQGEQRFGSENRFFLEFHDSSHPESSWKMKREFSSNSTRVQALLGGEARPFDVEFEYKREKHRIRAVLGILSR